MLNAGRTHEPSQAVRSQGGRAAALPALGARRLIFTRIRIPARPPFIICMPPPNVTGRAHLGHGSTYLPMDVLTRYHRMLGENADWLPGLDHAAIATEAVLVKELATQGLARDDLGREALRRARVGVVARTTAERSTNSSGCSASGRTGSATRFTMDDGLSVAVRKVFVQLVPRGIDLSRETPRQLGPERQNDGLRCGGGARRTRRHALARQVSLCRRRGFGGNHGRDDTARDDPRRRRHRRASRRRPVMPI